ncbi:MAG: hypothetical protein ACHQF0_08995 [Chitinophagales bacterium]
MNLQKSLWARIPVAVAFFFVGWLASGFLPGYYPSDGVKITLPVIHTAYPDSNKFVMCDLMPGPEVAGYSPFNGRYVKSLPSLSYLLQSCTYYFVADNNNGASISILLNDDYATAKDAMSSIRNFEKTAKENFGTDADIVDSLGDRAAIWGDDEVSLWIAIGNRVLEIDLKGQYPDVTATQKKNAAKALARLVMKKLKLK